MNFLEKIPKDLRQKNLLNEKVYFLKFDRAKEDSLLFNDDALFNFNGI